MIQSELGDEKTAQLSELVAVYAKERPTTALHIHLVFHCTICVCLFEIKIGKCWLSNSSHIVTCI